MGHKSIGTTGNMITSRFE